jgi:hypothetical protein
LRQQILDISVTEVESLVEPNGIADNIWRESVALVCIHHQIISFPAFNLAIPWRWKPEMV